MRHAVVHVGWPRTGTTTLQRILCRLRPELAAACILYPELTPRSASEAHLNHQHLGETLDGRRPRAEQTELLDRLDRELQSTRADTVVLSYESLCLVPPRRGAAETLAALFERRGFRASVLATIKPQAEYLNSTYTWRMQFLREGRGFRDYVQGETGGAALDYARLLAPWRSAFGGRIAAVPVRDVRSAEPLVLRVLESMGILDRVAGLLTAEDLALIDNRSPGPAVVEAARRLRVGGADLALGLRRREATRFMEDQAASLGVGRAAYQGMDAGLRAAVSARWAAANEGFAHAVWGTSWAARIADAPERAVNDLAGSADPVVTALVDATCLRFGIRLQGDRSRLLLALAHGVAALLPGAW